MNPDRLADRVEGMVHADTQVHERGVDLTVAEVYLVDAPGRIDFGGGELEAASLEPVETSLRNPGDDYQWWELKDNVYLVEFNERLTGRAPVRVEPRVELLERGGSLPSVTTTRLSRLPLATPDRIGMRSGDTLRIKENARVATVTDGSESGAAGDDSPTA